MKPMPLDIVPPHPYRDLLEEEQRRLMEIKLWDF